MLINFSWFQLFFLINFSWFQLLMLIKFSWFFAKVFINFQNFLFEFSLISNLIYQPKKGTRVNFVKQIATKMMYVGLTTAFKVFLKLQKCGNCREESREMRRALIMFYFCGPSLMQFKVYGHKTAVTVILWWLRR